MQNQINKSLVWISTPNSRESGHYTVLAIIETIAASAFGIWLFFATDYKYLLPSSLIIAFLMLLRSEQSVKLGVELFETYRKQEQISKPVFILTICLAFIAAFGVTWWLAGIWLSDHSGAILLWRAATLGLLAMSVGIAVTATQAMTETLGIAGLVAGAAAAMVAGVGTSTITGMGTIAGAEIVTIVGITAVAIVIGSATGAGMLFGINLRAMIIRVYATTRNLFSGLLQIPNNWKTLSGKTDLKTAPELLPNLPRTSIFHSGHATKSLIDDFKQRVYLKIAFRPIIILILFAPALLYRLYLKSTAWIYFPLVWLAYVPKVDKQPDGTLVWRSVRGTRKWEAFGFVFGAISLMLFLVYISNIAAFLAALIWPAENTDIPTFILFLQHLDTKAIVSWQGAWKGFLALGSLLTLVLYIWADHITKDKGKTPSQRTLRSVLVLANLKAMITLAWVLFTLGTVAYQLHSYGYMPAPLQSSFTWMWGEPCCLLKSHWRLSPTL